MIYQRLFKTYCKKRKIQKRGGISYYEQYRGKNKILHDSVVIYGELVM